VISGDHTLGEELQSPCASRSYNLV